MGDHVAVDVGGLMAFRGAGEEETGALIGMVECRICQEEDLAKNLESPCACSGSLKVCCFFYPSEQFLFQSILTIKLFLPQFHGIVVDI